ncbi:DUF2845 domain-containing protein [Catenovulum sp. SM1970]|uniref:DUF2845 domain-containing protein n=1 Tax=Marinifaba aquimaris TaxID=2741323 RepID=UPI001573D6BE|nr:DUF2845 domain-containing protein [Marinifaba aquimaris]NTS75622.1 DUF2845 domain-containing protein [Marinifaba aquimaris]
MCKMFFILFVVWLYLSTISTAQAANRIQCSKGSIKLGASKDQIIDKCGKANEKIKLDRDYRQDYWPSGKRELWIYQLDKRGFAKHLYIVKGKLALIEQGKRIN